MTKRKTYRRQSLTRFFLVLGAVVLLNILSSAWFGRVDLTDDRRYTLTDSTKKVLSELKDVVFVKVYLQGDFPAGFQQLAKSTKEILDEFKVYGGDKIQYEFIDPLSGKSQQEMNDILKQFAEKGLQPTNVQNRATDEYSQKLVVPGALVTYGSKEAPVNLLLDGSNSGAQSALNNSEAQLEYNFSRAIRQLTFAVKPKIGFVRGHGELDDFRLFDLLNELSAYYELEVVELEKTAGIASNIKTLVVAKPTSAFSEKDKFKIDQYVMNGGTVLWLVEALNAELDSAIIRPSFVTADYPLNLDDLLFRYGVRINPALVMDLQCNPVPLLVSGEGQRPQFSLFPCFYFPVYTPTGNHAIVKNIDAVRSQFSGTLDTLALASVKKTVLLHSSENSRLVFTPWLVDFRDLRNRPNVGEYNKKFQPTAVLLEGIFPSLYQNRVTTEMETVLRDSLRQPYRERSEPTKMIVIADGDLTANGYNADGQPLPMDYYRYTGEYFSNKNFMLNSVDYLTGFPQLISTRSKTIALRLLDEAMVKETKLQWQLINLLAPLALLLIFGIAFSWIRYLKFARN